MCSQNSVVNNFPQLLAFESPLNKYDEQIIAYFDNRLNDQDYQDLGEFQLLKMDYLFRLCDIL